MGTVVLSVDAELGWGFHDLRSPPDSRVEGARAGWRALAGLLEDYRIPATWAVVGHLALERCDAAHEDHPLGPGWFSRERGDWADRQDLRFAPELIDELQRSRVGHEIGAHSFSHVVHPQASREAVRAELEASRTAFLAQGLQPTSYVFPRNAIAHRDLLAEYGYRTYRGAGPDIGPHRRRLRKLLGAAGGSPPLVEPTVDRHGLVELPPSLFLFGFEGPARSAVAATIGDPITRQAKQGIDRAVEEDGVLHLWCHPNDLVTETAIWRVRRILAHLRRRLDGSPLEVRTMGTVATRARNGAPLPARIEPGHA